MAMAPHPEFPIVQHAILSSKYERVLMTRLRDKNSSTEEFREAANRLTELLVHRVVESLPSATVEIETPLAPYQGERLVGSIEFLSIMRSGDALLDIFSKHFPTAIINKILIQRDEVTALPHFKYMRISTSLPRCGNVIIMEPMIATGGTLSMVINLLKEKGLAESNIFIASICAAPEGLIRLKKLFPCLKVVTIAIDAGLNENKYIIPGLGDFGDRYFGT
jgi:uracil phosphoribosyltransferase